MVDRHESLRTAFPVTNGTPHQRIVEVDQVVGALEPVEVGEAEILQRVTAAVSASFDVTQAPPVRIELFRLAPRDHVVVITVHHICADGQSMVPLARDVAMAYEASRLGVEPAWPELAIGYPDYALWRRDMLGAESDPDSLVSEQLRFWRDTLTYFRTWPFGH